MILDNENDNYKVHEWISKYTTQGKMDVVTGYFTIGALAFVSDRFNDLIDEFRFILGDFVQSDNHQDRTLDLLNENLNLQAAFKLSKVAKDAVDFLKQDKVSARTLEANFCHAKAYIFKSTNDKDPQKQFYITGSSNLTEAGIGLKQTSNVELNTADFGASSDYKELLTWFKNIWKSPKAGTKKTILDSKGKKKSIPFKEYLIQEIEKIFIRYEPIEIYYKILFELFGKSLLEELDNPEFTRQVGRLENSVIYNSLYEFQKKGALSLIKMLQKYNGAILADAVGLGKTWTALAVMKYYQLQGREIILLCPKKLRHNWHQYKKHQSSRFEKDQFEYFIRYHTDLQAERLEKYDDRSDTFFTNDKPKLFVIDESHNLRNHKSKRYQLFLDEILKKNDDFKILMLSATPINNTLNDIRNQFKLIVKGDNKGFYETIGVRSIDYTFRAATRAFDEWRELDEPQIADFIKLLPSNFFKLSDSLTVARTREMIKSFQNSFEFPKKQKPENLFVTPKHIGNIESFEELFDHFPPMLSAYQPAFYIQQAEDIEKIHDEQQRDRFLVKMMYILLVKRLESSWYAFKITVGRILEHHQNALNKIKKYQEAKTDSNIDFDEEVNNFNDDDQDEITVEFTLGKKRKISLSEIDRAGFLEGFKKDIKKDIDTLTNLTYNLSRFEEKIEKESSRPQNYTSDDDKLETLIEKITEKRKKGENNNNPKVLIFTVYRDTGLYLFEQLIERGFDKIAFVSGTESKTHDTETATKNFEPILERFAPYTKLFLEKEWDYEPSKMFLSNQEKYREWQEWITENEPKTAEKIRKPIDILIATDALSEGQNFQDCDLVVNYDIHWNPVRVIQRMGRIDRLGSPNEKIFGINFWPSDNINKYLNLQKRVEDRMATMKLSGAEVDHEFSERFAEMAKDEELDRKQTARMLKQMETGWDDIEESSQSLGFDDLSLEKYRQELLEELDKNKDKYRKMPKAVYSGFRADKSQMAEEGLAALLGYPARPVNTNEHEYKSYELVYIDSEGNPILANQKEVLEALTYHKKYPRFVPVDIDKGKPDALDPLQNALLKWLEQQKTEEETDEEGNVKKTMGASAKDVLAKLKMGDKDAVDKIKSGESIDEQFKPEKYDLITWLIIS